MLFERRLREGLADGSVTVAFRRWRRPQVVAGHTYRTGDGPRVVAQAVDVVEPSALTARDARAAGFASVAELLASLRGDENLPLYRIRFTAATEPDPREVLRAAADLDDTERSAIDRRLDRLDRSAGDDGPWTRRALALIRDRPDVSAGQLAPAINMERDVFKRRVRSLKGLGLTISQPVGYRLSPRGTAYLEA